CGVMSGAGGCVCVFFSSRRRHTRLVSDWSSDVCSSDLPGVDAVVLEAASPGGESTHATVGISEEEAERARLQAPTSTNVRALERSEERRVGKERRSGWGRERSKKKERVERTAKRSTQHS